MATWKVIALVNGQIEAVSGPAAQDRPGAHEWIVWAGQAADKAEALKCAEKADPRVDLEWMRIRYDRGFGATLGSRSTACSPHFHISTPLQRFTGQRYPEFDNIYPAFPALTF